MHPIFRPREEWPVVGSRTSGLPGRSDRSPPYRLSTRTSRELEQFAERVSALLHTQRCLRRTLLPVRSPVRPRPSRCRRRRCTSFPSRLGQEAEPYWGSCDRCPSMREIPAQLVPGTMWTAADAMPTVSGGQSAMRGGAVCSTLRLRRSSPNDVRTQPVQCPPLPRRIPMCNPLTN